MAHLAKGWLTPFSSRRKFSSSTLSYSLSKILDRRSFEVVNESNIDIHDLSSEQPDVIVYDKKSDYKPLLLIEITNHRTLNDTLNSMEVMADIYHVPEAFVYDIDQQSWFKIANRIVSRSAESSFFGINLQSVFTDSLNRYAY
jgi:hypothetical protein